MRFLIVNADYPDYLRWLYGTRPDLAEQPYDEQVQARVESLQGSADFYARNLRALGHEAWVVWPNNKPMQLAWAREHGVPTQAPLVRRVGAAAVGGASRVAGRTPLRLLKSALRPVLGPLREDRWMYQVLAAQIKTYRPDVLLNQTVDSLSGAFFHEQRAYAKVIVGQIAAPLSETADLRAHDFMVSSLPNLVDRFQRHGMPAVLQRLAFEPAVLLRLGEPAGHIATSFVGSFTRGHTERVRILEHLCERVEIGVWGSRVDRLPSFSPVRSRYRGEAWGIEMYRLLRASRVTVNNHEAWAGAYANNMRLFEATGVGTLLVTDWKANLREMFEPGTEVVTYRRPEECAELVRYYLEHERERDEIALAGHRRTLREHTYYHRMQELVDLVQSRVPAGAR